MLHDPGGGARLLLRQHPQLALLRSGRHDRDLSTAATRGSDGKVVEGASARRSSSLRRRPTAKAAVDARDDETTWPRCRRSRTRAEAGKMAYDQMIGDRQCGGQCADPGARSMRSSPRPAPSRRVVAALGLEDRGRGLRQPRQPFGRRPAAAVHGQLCRRGLLDGGGRFGRRAGAARPGALRRGPAARGHADRSRATDRGARQGRPPLPLWTYGSTGTPVLCASSRATALRATLVNQLAEHTSIHWHGIRVPNAKDGVPYITQQPVRPGEQLRLRLRAGRHRHLFLPPALRHRRASSAAAWSACSSSRATARCRSTPTSSSRCVTTGSTMRGSSCHSRPTRAPAAAARSAACGHQSASPARRSPFPPAATFVCACSTSTRPG